ncbi:indolepyruvate ferredoxin oxidoreductase subunit beta [Candidatus Bathyarchaeota archaeon]|nr:MAG: indolepyruvate ferredoxin oxidoreductase subunit beta [Candidatus Bathyarchaeota archaeon]
MMADVVVCGVGGQGVLLLAEVLGTAALKSGLDVRVSEIHGMAQRGGSVICHVRAREGAVYAPTILDGSADVLLALELAEAIRAVRFVGPGTLALVSTRAIRPVMVSLGLASYPSREDVEAALEEAGARVLFVDALKLAEEAGSPLAQNMVMAGALYATGLFPVRRDALIRAIEELVPPRYIEVNLKAFELGEKAVEGRVPGR